MAKKKTNVRKSKAATAPRKVPVGCTVLVVLFFIFLLVIIIGSVLSWK